MTSLTVTRLSAARPDAAWALLSDFGAIDLFNPNLKDSHVIGDGPERGPGATRQCNLKDGRNFIRERVVDWQEGRSYTVDIYEGTMPLKDTRATLLVEPSAGGSRLTMTISYRPKYGVLGHLMDVAMLRRMMRTSMRRLVDGLDAKASGGLRLAA